MLVALGAAGMCVPCTSVIVARRRAVPSRAVEARRDDSVNDEQLKSLRDEWPAALADAGFDVKQVRLYPFEGEQSDDGNRAYYFTPGQDVHYDVNFPDEKGGQIEDANKHRDRHRLAVWVDSSTPVLGARLRHELEHARQVEAHGNHLFDINDLVLAVLWVKLEGLKGSGQLYNAIPLEVDANAAAARFAWQRYGEDVVRDLADPASVAGVRDGVLFRSLTPPGPLESLPLRMLAFLYQFADLCQLFAERRRRPFDDLLEEAWPGMARAWAALVAVELRDREAAN